MSDRAEWMVYRTTSADLEHEPRAPWRIGLQDGGVITTLDAAWASEEQARDYLARVVATAAVESWSAPSPEAPLRPLREPRPDYRTW